MPRGLHPEPDQLHRTGDRLDDRRGQRRGGHPGLALPGRHCGNLGYKPKLYTRIWGKTNRGAHPKLRAVLEPRKGDANVGRTALTLPRSEFLDQAHIKTICTRVQFAAGACPAASVYGWAKARRRCSTRCSKGRSTCSSNHKLPDLVAALKGPVAFNLVGRIDSKNKGIRNTFESPPDVPVSKFILYMKGGQKGLLVNSRNICNQTYRSNANMRGQNGRKTTLKPVLKNSRCKRARRSRAEREGARPARTRQSIRWSKARRPQRGRRAFSLAWDAPAVGRRYEAHAYHQARGRAPCVWASVRVCSN